MFSEDIQIIHSVYLEDVYDWDKMGNLREEA